MGLHDQRNMNLSYTVLAVDDESEVLNALKRQFRREYRVLTATSGEEAEKVLQDHPVEVIVSDERMPGMTGTVFFQKIKNLYPEPIRILLTGYSDISAVISAINDGNVFRYVKKPWDPAELATVVEDAFEKYYLIAENKRLTEELLFKNDQLRIAKAQVEELLKQKIEKLNVVQYELDILKRAQNMF